MSGIIAIDFERDSSYLKIPLPVPDYPQEPIYPDWPSAWKGLESILPGIIKRFNVKQGAALEFGVEYGYSTAALAQLFEHVTGVDTFLGDPHSDLQLGGGKTRPRTDFVEFAKKNLAPWPNISVNQLDYKEWIQLDTGHYDLIHVDIVHTFEDTFACGRWAADHAPVVIFHDTMSFAEVQRAVAAVADETGKTFYNYPNFYGLGIVA